MTILVNHCYDWVSYHLINELLMEGYAVTGIHDKSYDINDHLSMFLGRNSLFREGFDHNDWHRYEAAIIFQNALIPNDIQIQHTIQIENQNNDLTTENITNINLPLLFGEWMPMNDKGLFFNEQFISFQSENFKNQAIYIKDFSRLLIGWLKNTQLPNSLKIYSANFRQNKAVLLENPVYVYDNIPIKQRLEKVLEHYKRYNDLYPK